LAEMERLRWTHDVRHYFFLDYTFTLDNSWVRQLCAGIHGRGLDVSWMCQTRVDCLDPETLRLMKTAGCTGVWLGVESPELAQRRYLSKGKIAFPEIDAAVRMIRDAGIEVLSFVMVGMPNETTSSLQALNDWLEESQVYYSLSTFQRRPGTPLARDSGLVLDSWGDLDRATAVLGESSLRVDDLGWFCEFHDRSARRVSNVMRRQTTDHR
jgi:anaerobic magnesium-protoporphyrin IX monomethyl ester cyclase